MQTTGYLVDRYLDWLDMLVTRLVNSHCKSFSCRPDLHKRVVAMWPHVIGDVL
jgi:hypothetical protein